MKKLLTILSIIFISHAAFGINISGTVVDEQNEPLPGANVTLSDNKSIGIATNIDGKFELKNINENDEITISYIGFETKTIPAGSAGGNIILNETTTSLDTLTVTAKAPKVGDICTLNPEKPEHANAKETRMQMVNGVLKCMPTKCTTKQYEITDYKCIDITGMPCPKFPSGAASGIRKYDQQNDKVICEITECKAGYDHKRTENICQKIGGECTTDALAKLEGATAGNREYRDGKEICIPTKCDETQGYELSGERCVPISGNCTKSDLPPGATSGERKFVGGKEICAATACENNWALDKDRGVCEFKLSQEDSEAKVDELRENAQAMKDKEQSLANRTLGAAAIGASGIGAGQFLGATAEKTADDAAERDMAAYLATFTCDYGAGRNIKGGETEIILPGGNELMPLYTEYKTLAGNLKTTKESLGLLPGIESEVVFDKANTGLYDNAAVGRTGGAFTSLSRALSEPESADAAAWATQRADSASRAQTGLITAGAGIVGGAVGNILVNSAGKNGKNIFGQTVAQESSATINAKYAKIASGVKQLKQDIVNIPIQPESCGDGAIGTHPNCDCGSNKNYVTETKKCVDIPTIDCGKHELVFTTSDNTCSCRNGHDFIDSEKTCKCEAPKELLDGICESKKIEKQLALLEAPQPSSLIGAQVQMERMEIELPSSMFDINKSEVKEEYKEKIINFAQIVKDQTDFKGCYFVSGHTDFTGSESLNKTLSQARANSVRDILINNGISKQLLKSVGEGWTRCETKGQCKNDCKTKVYPPDASCRKVLIQIINQPCSEIQ